MVASSAATPVPEFMWCQRSDRVYVTVKVADCQDASVDVSSDHKLTFRGRGSGMCGQRDYALSIDLAKPVVKAECRWFVCGPSVRVRLQKMERGPYWAALMPKGVKMAQCKVDWQSWLDEDEESEVSAAPNGFDVDELHMKMLSEEDDFYKDPEHLTTSESEGEEENSIMLDDGMNDIGAVTTKFRAFDEEKKVRDHTKLERRQLRERTRDAVRFAEQRARDVRFGRPTRDLTAAEEELIAGAPTLRKRLKEQKAAEKAHFQAQWWHQRRPDAKHTAALMRGMRAAAAAEVQAAQGSEALADKAGRNAARLAAYAAALRAAVRARPAIAPLPGRQVTRGLRRAAAPLSLALCAGLPPPSPAVCAGAGGGRGARAQVAGDNSRDGARGRPGCGGPGGRGDRGRCGARVASSRQHGEPARRGWRALRCGSERGGRRAGARGGGGRWHGGWRGRGRERGGAAAARGPGGRARAREQRRGQRRDPVGEQRCRGDRDAQRDGCMSRYVLQYTPNTSHRVSGVPPLRVRCALVACSR